MRIGVDIVEIDRMRKRQDGLASYVLSTDELTVYNTKKGVNQLNYLAGRFAAKEAIIKALKDTSILLKDISILNDENGAPYVVYQSYDVSISISHEQHYVVAMVIIEEGNA